MKILSALAITSIALLSGCNLFPSPTEGLPEKPLLQKSFRGTPVREQLDAVGAVRVVLRCEKETMTVSGIFDFWALDGRKPVTVAGKTACTEPGALFVWREPNLVYARENYKTDLIEREVQGLLKTGGIRPMVTHRDNEAVARAIEHSLPAVVQPRPVLRAEFTCDKPGDGYRYVASTLNGGQHVESGVLKTRCPEAHQNFVVASRIIDPMTEDDDELKTKPVLRVQDFNAVSPETILTAFGEYVGDGVPKSKF